MTSATLMNIGQFFLLLNLAFLLSFYTMLPKLMKICQKFLSHWAHSTKSHFLAVTWPLWPWPLTHVFLTVKLCLPFIILHHPAKAHINWSITFWVIKETARNSHFQCYLTPVTFTCDLQRRPIFLTIELSFHFIIMHHPELFELLR